MAVLLGLGIPEPSLLTRAGNGLTRAIRVLDTVPARVTGTPNLGGFAAALAASAASAAIAAGDEIDSRKRARAGQPYPFYCAVLYTAEAGLDYELHRYIVRTHRERVLDGLTASTCLLLVLESLSGESRRRTKPLNRGDVFAIAESLQLNPDYLPAAVIFCEAAAHRRAYFRWRDLLPGDVEQEKYIAQVLRVMVTCMRTTAAVRDHDQRLHAFDREFAHSRKQLPWVSSRFRLSSDSFDRGVTTLDALGKLAEFASKISPP